MESKFRNAPDGVWHDLWKSQISKDPKFYTHREKAYGTFIQDPRGVIYILETLLLHHISLNHNGCGLHIKTVNIN